MSKKLKFIHAADLHLGSFRENKLKELNFNSFVKLIDFAIKEKVDFVMFAGDLFNIPLISIDLLNSIINQLKRLKEADIPLYVIGGSHDYSDLGQSYLSVLNNTGILKDVFNYKIDEMGNYIISPIVNDNLKLLITGVVGKKKELEMKIFQNLKINNISKDKNNYLKIFMFHTTLNDFKPDFLEGQEFKINTKLLPKGFDFYAGGHIHKNMIGNLYSGKISYSGALFPNNFRELVMENPSFNLCFYDFESKNLTIEKKNFNFFDKVHIKININNLKPEMAKEKILEKFNNLEISNKLVLLEISGIVDGKVKDINLSEIINILYEKNPLLILRNTYKLFSKDIKFENVNINKTQEEIEIEMINNFTSKIDNLKYVQIINNLIKSDFSKREDEKKIEYEERVISILENIFKIN
jgi:DNA repair exonuclease SbcCD nuclease subunit